MWTRQTECLVGNAYRREDRLVVMEKQRLDETSLENHVQEVYLAVRLVMIRAIRTGFQVIRVCVDDNPAICRLMLVHKDCPACNDQAEQDRLEQG